MHPESSTSPRHEAWYSYGLAALCLEMLIAVAVSGYAVYLTFHGMVGSLR